MSRFWSTYFSALKRIGRIVLLGFLLLFSLFGPLLIPQHMEWPDCMIAILYVLNLLFIVPAIIAIWELDYD